VKSTTRITLDLQRPNIAVIAYGVQNDRDSRYIEAQIVDGGTAWPLPAGASALIRFRKPDNTGGAYDTLEDNVTPAVTWSGSVATLVMAEQVLTVPGDVCMELNFYSAGGERLTAFSWTLRVRPSVLTDAEIISTDYYNILTAQIASGIQAAENAAASAEAAQESADAAAATLAAAAATLAAAVQYTPQTGKTAAEKAAARANIGLAYNVNDTLASSASCVFPCYVGGGNIYLQIVVPKLLEPISTVTVTKLTGSLVGVNGVIDSASNVDWLSRATVSAIKNGSNSVRIQISKAFTNVTANTPGVFWGLVGLKFT
jgi:hypothetical protein